MTYSKQPVGTLYAAAGLGQGPSGISPPFRRYGFRTFSGLGADPGEVASKPVRDLQRMLMQKGYNVGRTGADNIFGDKTRSALNRALGRDVSSQISVSSDRHTIRMPVSFWVELSGLRDGAGGESTTPPSPRPSPTPSPIENGDTEVVPDAVEETVVKALPWAIGAVAFAGIGAYFVYRGRRRRVAANRRRRRRRRRSSRRRR